VNLESQLVLFRDHEFKDPKSDGDAAFRTWLRRAAAYLPPTGTGRGGKPPPGANFNRLKALAEQAEREEKRNAAQ
jgi:hypothetical protein